MTDLEKEVFTVHDIIEAGFNLEPLKCLHCNHVGEVIWDQYVVDGYCQSCGRWQLEDEENQLEPLY